jgi:hypothetical protein
MSASTENLLEQIRNVERMITSESLAGRSVLDLQEQLRLLNEKFTTSAQALNEGKTILKG